MALRDILSDDRLYEQYWEFLNSTDPRIRLYVYRWESGKMVKPAIYKGPPFPEPESYLQKEHDGGDFCVMIRRGEKMLLTGLISICPLPSRRAAFETFDAKYHS